MSRQRKQKLADRFVEINAVPSTPEVPAIPASVDPLFSLGFLDNDNLQYTQPCDPRPIDMIQSISSSWDERGTSPTAWLLDQTSPLYNTDGFLDVTSLLGIDETLSFLGEDCGPSPGNKETFQDLKFTSTPKAVHFDDSGIEDSVTHQCKRSKLNNSDILHNITDPHQLPSQMSYNDSLNSPLDITTIPSSSSPHPFLNTPPRPVAASSESFQEESECENSRVERNVAIIRKRIQLVHTAPRTEDYPGRNNVKNQVMYYTGLTSYEKAIGVLKHIRLPKSQLSTYKMHILTFMKLRLDLQWTDLAYRFDVEESVVKKIFHDTLRSLALSLVEFLPWRTTKGGNIRKLTKKFFIHVVLTLKSQILVIFGDNKKPVLHVTNAYTLHKQSYESILKLECQNHFLNGDIICFSTTPTQYFRVNIANNDFTISKMEAIKNKNGSHFVVEGQRLLDLLRKYSLLSRTEFPAELNLEYVLLACCALTNLNAAPEITNAMMKKVYHRSELLTQRQA